MSNCTLALVQPLPSHWLRIYRSSTNRIPQKTTKRSASGDRKIIRCRLRPKNTLQLAMKYWSWFNSFKTQFVIIGFAWTFQYFIYFDVYVAACSGQQLIPNRSLYWCVCGSEQTAAIDPKQAIILMCMWQCTDGSNWHQTGQYTDVYVATYRRQQLIPNRPLYWCVCGSIPTAAIDPKQAFILMCIWQRTDGSNWSQTGLYTDVYVAAYRRQQLAPNRQLYWCVCGSVRTGTW